MNASRRILQLVEKLLVYGFDAVQVILPGRCWNDENRSWSCLSDELSEDRSHQLPARAVRNFELRIGLHAAEPVRLGFQTYQMAASPLTQTRQVGALTISFECGFFPAVE